MKEYLSKVGMHLFVIDQILVSQNKAISSLIKLQSYGVTGRPINKE
jgi:hypothetical protein